MDKAEILELHQNFDINFDKILTEEEMRSALFDSIPMESINEVNKQGVEKAIRDIFQFDLDHDGLTQDEFV